ncbi:MAG: response regulator transcription factor [Bacteroidetes bacterium]|nr:response regulator transcription factor [Bacteroidota bacterium]
MAPLRLAIFEDNHQFRDSLLQLFRYSEGVEVAGAFPNTLRIQEIVGSLKPDVILMDIDMPGMSGIEATVLAKTVLPNVQVVMLTVSEEEERIFQALRNGASGYILKKAGSDEILDAVLTVSQGGSPMTPAIARKVLRFFHNGGGAPTPTPVQPKMVSESDQLFNSLSPREQEILEGLVDGLSYKMIAARFYISTDTVKNHIQGIYRKLHVNSKGEAISYVLKNGYGSGRNDVQP